MEIHMVYLYVDIVIVVHLLSHVPLCAMDCSTPGSLVFNYLSEFVQTHVH